MKFKLEPFLAAGFVFSILAFPGGATVPLTWKCFNAIWGVSKALFNLADLTEKAEHQDKLQQYSKAFLNRLRNIQSIVEKDSPRLGYGIRNLSINVGSVFGKSLNELDERRDLHNAQEFITKINQLVKVLGEECQRNPRLREEVNALRAELDSFVGCYNKHEKAGGSNEGNLLGAIFDIGKAFAGLKGGLEEVPVVYSGGESSLSHLAKELPETSQQDWLFHHIPKLDIPAPILAPPHIQTQGNG